MGVCWTEVDMLDCLSCVALWHLNKYSPRPNINFGRWLGFWELLSAGILPSPVVNALHTNPYTQFFLSSGKNLSKRYMYYIGFSPFPLLSCLIAIVSYHIPFDCVDYPHLHFKCFWNSPVGSYQRLCHAMIFAWYWYVQPWFWTLRELSNIHLTEKEIMVFFHVI